MIINKQRHLLRSNDQHVTGKRALAGLQATASARHQGRAKSLRLAHPKQCGKRKRFVKCDPALCRRAGIYGTGRCSSHPFWFKMSL